MTKMVKWRVNVLKKLDKVKKSKLEEEVKEGEGGDADEGDAKSELTDKIHLQYKRELKKKRKEQEKKLI